MYSGLRIKPTLLTPKKRIFSDPINSGHKIKDFCNFSRLHFRSVCGSLVFRVPGVEIPLTKTLYITFLTLR